MAGKLAGQIFDNGIEGLQVARLMNGTFSGLTPTPSLERAGLRFGLRGTHTSRTMMLREVAELFATVPANATRDEYRIAVVEENVLGKRTWATRRSSRQRLSELYGLDPTLPLFRVLRRLWHADPHGRPVVALLCALARDPLLRSTAAPVLALAEGHELVRGPFSAVIRDAVGRRLNDAIVDKVARNAGSTWTQSGHLEGRVRKLRRRITPTPGPVALALWLGELQGLAGFSMLSSDWAAVLDRRGPALLPLALEAKRFGLIHAHGAGSVVEISTRHLDPAFAR